MELTNILIATREEMQDAYEAGTMYDYINDVLEVEYTMNLSGELRGVKMLTTFGGPNVYVNTRTEKIEGYGIDGEHVEIELPFHLLNEIEETIISLI